MSQDTTDIANELLAENAALKAQIAELEEKIRRSEDYYIGVDMERMDYIEKYQKLAAEAYRWCPDSCPVTNRPFFMWIEHPTGGMVPTYGGPYDSYTIPTADGEGEFTCERYDHDEGAWVDDVWLNVRLIDDQEEILTDATANALRAEVINSELSIQAAGAMLSRILDSGSKQAAAYAEFADMVAKFAKQIREGK